MGGGGGVGWASRQVGGQPGTGADPGFFLGGGAPLRNDVTDR